MSEPLVKYKYVKYDTGGGYIREGLEPHTEGEWFKAADVDALLRQREEELARHAHSIPIMQQAADSLIRGAIATRDDTRAQLAAMTRLKVEAMKAWNTACDELAAMTEARNQWRAEWRDHTTQLKQQLATSQARCKQFEEALKAICALKQDGLSASMLTGDTLRMLAPLARLFNQSRDIARQALTPTERPPA